VRLVKTQPSQPSDIFAGQDFVMLTRYDGSGATRLRFEGRTANGPIEWTSRAVFPASSSENSFIARLWATQRIGYLSAEKRKNGGSSEVDDEIKQLGEQYGIPTEFSSYFVVEPGMQPRQGMGDVRLLNQVVGGVAGAPTPSNATKSFEAARASSAQRAAMSVSAVDDAIGLSKDDKSVRREGNRLFVLRDGVWTDRGLKDSMSRIKIRAYSPAYFKILDVLPELREPFALGDKVIIAGRSVAIEITSTGVDALTDREISDLQLKW